MAKKRTTNSATQTQQALAAMAKNRAIAVADATRATIRVINSSFVQHGYSSLSSLVNGARIAAGGASEKGIVNSAMGSAVSSADTAVAASLVGSVRCFGWKIRLTASVLQFSGAPYFLNVGFPTGAVGAGQQNALVSDSNAIFRLAVYAIRPPVDVFVLALSNGAGFGTLVPGAVNEVCAVSTQGTLLAVSAAAVTADNNITIETLNERDLISRPGTWADEDDGEGIDFASQVS